MIGPASAFSARSPSRARARSMPMISMTEIIPECLKAGCLLAPPGAGAAAAVLPRRGAGVGRRVVDVLAAVRRRLERRHQELEQAVVRARRVQGPRVVARLAPGDAQ